jgi:hypothetical protein
VIILSGVLVVLAIALLVTGIVTGNTGHEVAGLDGLKLIYVSIGVSIISALCLAIGVFVRRKELFGTAGAAPAKKKTAAAGRSGKAARPAKAKARVGAGEETTPSLTPASATDVPAETTVYVVRGRKRYHLETCRQLAGRDKEELTFEEAREEGFTPCTACLPDTALAARAAVTDTAPVEAIPPVESPDRDDSDVASVPDVTRVDLPVTRVEPDETVSTHDPSTKDLSTEGFGAEPAPEPLAETTDLSGAAELTTPAEPVQPAAERPAARSRSLFEPLDRGDGEPDTEPDTEDATSAGDDEVARETEDRPEPSEPDDSASTEPEPVETEAADHEAAEAGDADVTEVTEPEDVTEPEPATPAEIAGDDDEPAVAEAESAEPDTTVADDADHDDEPEHSGDRPELPFVRILSGTRRYHRPSCALIEDIADDADDLESVSPEEAKERGCTPCLVCQPDKDPDPDDD